jgi:divalent metal cation (Fe/Co/Zn/Cd) transporter
MKYLVELHALVLATISVRDGHELAHQLQATLKKELPHLGHVIIHIEPTEEQ